MVTKSRSRVCLVSHLTLLRRESDDESPIRVRGGRLKAASPQLLPSGSRITFRGEEWGFSTYAGCWKLCRGQYISTLQAAGSIESVSMTLQAGLASPPPERTLASIAGNRSRDCKRTWRVVMTGITWMYPGGSSFSTPVPPCVSEPLVLWSTRIHCSSVSDLATPEPWYTRAGLLLRYHIRWAYRRDCPVR